MEDTGIVLSLFLVVQKMMLLESEGEEKEKGSTKEVVVLECCS